MDLKLFIICTWIYIFEFFFKLKAYFDRLSNIDPSISIHMEMSSGRLVYFIIIAFIFKTCNTKKIAPDTLIRHLAW